jgi:SAM-dependent methyltransferase
LRRILRRKETLYAANCPTYVGALRFDCLAGCCKDVRAVQVSEKDNSVRNLHTSVSGTRREKLSRAEANQRKIPPEVIAEYSGCANECDPADEPLFDCEDTIHHLPGRWTVVRCRTCGLIRTNPRPSRSTIGYYYPTNYGPYLSTLVPTVNVQCPGQTARQPSDSTDMQTFRRTRDVLRRIVKFCVNDLPETRPGRALEVGCASGSFLEVLRKRGWRAEGLEFSPEAANTARNLGFKVITGAVETAAAPAEPFDLIVGWMVLEHLHDPVEGLRKLHSWCRPGAWLVVSTPDVSTWEFGLFRRNWFALQVPNHLYHFTPDTLRALLERCGWRVVRITHQRILTDLIGSVGIVLKRYSATREIGRRIVAWTDRPTRVHLILYPIAWLLSLFGQTARMNVWARSVEIESR